MSLIRLDDVGDEVGRASATGFMWKLNDSWFLITNWHNVTGINPETLQHLGQFTPTHFQVSLKYWHDSNPRSVIANRTYTLPLYEGDQPVWLEHPHRHRVDCVAIPISLDDVSEFAGKAFNSLDLTDSYEPSVGDECFVIGYPKGLMAPGRTPIWKRASIATEATIDYDGRPILLIDTATRKGMSGAPVLARHHGIHAPNGILDSAASIGTVENFLGIYSGRLGDDELGVQLGRVWKAKVISEILEQNERGLDPMLVVYPVEGGA